MKRRDISKKELQMLIEQHHHYLIGDRQYLKADLSGVNLKGADLRGVDLTGADLRGADLSGTDLRGAIMKVANLRGVDLSSTYLDGADMRLADLKCADVSFSYLNSETNLLLADIEYANFYASVKDDVNFDVAKNVSFTL